jgi:hypothetical protein
VRGAGGRAEQPGIHASVRAPLQVVGDHGELRAAVVAVVHVADGLAESPARGVGLALPGVRLVTRNILAVIAWCFDCKIT